MTLLSSLELCSGCWVCILRGSDCVCMAGRISGGEAREGWGDKTSKHRNQCWFFLLSIHYFIVNIKRNLACISS